MKEIDFLKWLGEEGDGARIEMTFKDILGNKESILYYYQKGVFLPEVTTDTLDHQEIQLSDVIKNLKRVKTMRKLLNSTELIYGVIGECRGKAGGNNILRILGLKKVYKSREEALGDDRAKVFKINIEEVYDAKLKKGGAVI